MSSKVEKIFFAVDKFFEFLIIIAFISMVVVGLAQVFSRYILRDSLSWSEEFQKYMHIWIIFLAVPLAYKQNAHIGMDILYKRFPSAVQRIIRIMIDVLWLCFGFVSSFYSLKIMKVASGQKSAGLGVSMNLVYSCILIGGLYLILMASRKLWVSFKGSGEEEVPQ